jgi:hypothetical protein
MSQIVIVALASTPHLPQGARFTQWPSQAPHPKVIFLNQIKEAHHPHLQIRHRRPDILIGPFGNLAGD